jgi:hypothetical protein
VRAQSRLNVVLVALLALAMACLSACGSSELGTGTIERTIARSIRSGHALTVIVSCPPHVPRQRGYVFICNAELQVGTYPVRVTELANGRTRYSNQRPLITLNVIKVQRAIEASIVRQKHVDATVVCPREVLQQAAVSFLCTATVRGSARRYDFSVKELDNSGHVRYLGL